MQIYGMKTENMTNPTGIDHSPRLSWKISDTSENILQNSYTVTIALDNDFSQIISAIENISSSLYADYSGELKPLTKYYWRVEITDNTGRTAISDISYFETGLMGANESVWSGAKWISSSYKRTNTDSLTAFSFSADFRTAYNKNSGKVGFVICARNKDNYILIEIDMLNRLVHAYNHTDNAWTDAAAEITPLGKKDGYPIPENAAGKDFEWNNADITMDHDKLTLKINSIEIINENGFIPDNIPNKPRTQAMLSAGFKGYPSEFKNISIKDISSGDIYPDTEDIILPEKIKDGILSLHNEIYLINPFPAINVRHIFDEERSDEIESAYLCCCAMGFYDVYINGEKINHSFYNPGFTDYRKRIYYQVYNVTGHIKNEYNVIGAVIAKGYYSGYLGYNGFPMVYGEQNKFIAKLVIKYTDGGERIIVSDDKWQFTDKGPVTNADYLQGEDYDARLEFDWNDKRDGRWKECGVYDFPKYACPTNGSFKNPVIFEMPSYEYPYAEIERILPSVIVSQIPKGHFIYDFGQNMVGTIRLRAKAKRGLSIKLRYGEMLCNDGRIYLENLRNAANTDTYTFKGSDTEEFIPSFTSHGFRYAEISGNGYILSENDISDIVLDGLVITNTPEKTSAFECSNKDINKLQSNIEWGQRGNSLLVFTDCPQRNERMGWTGDAQVFAATAAYNMDIRQFMNKWLIDVRDAQLLYNRSGAVPDTAPLGGDNRITGGCGGWGDAAVIVPWEMYLAYGDERILSDNYEMMKRWVDYQALPERRNNGLRTIDGKKMYDKSDLSQTPFIQIQQSRGDHLAFDESTPFILSATAYAARSAYLLARSADILGFEPDAEKYNKRFEDIKKAFCEAWVKPDGTIAYWGEMSKSYKDKNGNIINQTYYSEQSHAKPSQTAYALAVDFDLIPPEKLENTAAAFKRSIDDMGGKLSVGFLGISHLMPALTKVHLDDTAFSILEQTEYPGWLYSVKNGATTIWERWNSYTSDGKFGDANMNSFNHYSYGAVGEWMFKNILGINTSDKRDGIGYKHIILKPHCGGSLTYAKGYYESINGRIVSQWHIDNNNFIYECTIPANTTAEICLSAERREDITVISGNARYVKNCGKTAVFECGSGIYRFSVKI